MHSINQQTVHRAGYSGTADSVREEKRELKWPSTPRRDTALTCPQSTRDTARHPKSQPGVSALEMHDVCLRTADIQQAIDIPFLAVGVAEIFGFLGHCSAGISVLIDLLSGRKMPTSGTITIMGRNVQRASCQALFGVVPREEINSPGDDSTAYEHLVFQATLMGMSKRLTTVRIPEVLEYVGLTHYCHLRVGAFPTLMKRRLALARALLNEPQLLLLDEFTRDLGQKERESLWQLLRSLHDMGKTLVFTTCTWEEVDALCSQAALLSKDGQIERIWQRA